MRLLGLLLAVFALSPARAAASGEIFTVAGTGTPGAVRDGQPATRAELPRYAPIAGLPDGTFLVGDGGRVWHVDAQGRMRRVAGTDISGDRGDGGPALRAEISIGGISALPGGGFLICDATDEKIRMVDAHGVITTVAGGGKLRRDGVPATQADLDPATVAALPGGGFLVGDYRNHVRLVGPDGVIRTIAGNGKLPREGAVVSGPARAAAIAPADLDVASDGSVLIADYLGARVDRLAPDGTISTVVRGKSYVRFGPISVAALPDGGFLLSDDSLEAPSRVWRVGADGTKTAIAGGGPFITTAPDGLQQRLDGQDALGAQLGNPAAIVAMPDGGVLFSEGVRDDSDFGTLVRYIAPPSPQVLSVALLRDRGRVFGPGRPNTVGVALTQPAAVTLTVGGRSATAPLPAGTSEVALPGPPRGRRPHTLSLAATGADGRRAYDRARVYPSPWLPDETARLATTRLRAVTPFGCRRFGPTRVDCDVADIEDECTTVAVSFAHHRLRWGEYGCAFRRHPRYTIAPHAARRREWRCDDASATCPPRLFGPIDEAALVPSN